VSNWQCRAKWRFSDRHGAAAPERSGPVSLACDGHRDQVRPLRERLSRLFRGRGTALRGLSGTTFIGVTILAVAAMSVAVLVLLGATASHAAPVRSAAAISMTRLVADAKAGQLSNAVVDETALAGVSGLFGS
jgi:hypothetical protein